MSLSLWSGCLGGLLVDLGLKASRLDTQTAEQPSFRSGFSYLTSLDHSARLTLVYSVLPVQWAVFFNSVLFFAMLGSQRYLPFAGWVLMVQALDRCTLDAINLGDPYLSSPL